MLGAGQEKILRHWLKNLKDWNISRNIVWGIRIPAWYSPDGKFVVSIEKPEGDYIQETDTFDTWFSSGQWPVVTLKTNDKLDFEVLSNYCYGNRLRYFAFLGDENDASWNLYDRKISI